MRHLLFAVVALSMFAGSATKAEAARARRVYSGPRTYSSYSEPRRMGFFASLMEFERRKNAFLFGW